VGGAAGEDGGGGDADVGVGDVALGVEGGDAVGDVGDLEAVVEAEDDYVEVVECGEGDGGGGGEFSGGGVEIGVDDVAGDVDLGAAWRRGVERGRCEGEQDEAEDAKAVGHGLTLLDAMVGKLGYVVVWGRAVASRYPTLCKVRKG